MKLFFWGEVERFYLVFSTIFLRSCLYKWDFEIYFLRFKLLWCFTFPEMVTVDIFSSNFNSWFHLWCRHILHAVRCHFLSSETTLQQLPFLSTCVIVELIFRATFKSFLISFAWNDSSCNYIFCWFEELKSLKVHSF